MITYNSMSEFGRAVEGAQRKPSAGFSSYEGRDEFAGMPYTEALAIAKQGGAWAKGARDLAAVKLSQFDIDTEIVAPILNASVAGFAPNVPAFLAGQPDCMFSMQDEVTREKVIKMTVTCNACYEIEAETFFYRGRAILAAIVELEKQGYSVELTALMSSTPSRKSNLQETWAVRIKNAGESLSVASLAFALCSAAFQRRLNFRLKEASQDFWRCTKKAYGYSLDIMPEWSGMHFDGITPKNEGRYSSPQIAVRTIGRAINGFLSE